MMLTSQINGRQTMIASQKIRRPRWWAALALAALLLAALPAPTQPAVAQAVIPSSGIVCTTSPSATFTLTATSGSISLPDGNTVYMWGFADGSGPFQYPGPVLCVNQGDTVTIVLNNTLAVPVSIMFPGQEGVLANGLAEQPVYSGADLVSLATMAAPGGSATYSFVASEPGTYLYESGTDPGLQVQMGLAGALVVRPGANNPGAGEVYAYARSDSRYSPASEYMMLFSEIDPALHQAVERGDPPNLAAYQARYFLINGRAFPDTIAPNAAAWLPDQPYSSLAHIRPYDATNPYPALMRLLSVGPKVYPFHPHGNHARVVGRDGRALEDSAQVDMSYEKFSIPLGPGQTWDVTFDWRDVEAWDASGNPVPVTIPRDQNLTFGPYYSGSPYLGSQEALPPGSDAQNQCGEYYHVAHNHALEQTTSWGMTMSGQLTYTRIDPPLPNNCP
jgi:FtsP/CotA-like multicopper oxidase with cupredoxin domain